MTEMFIYAVVEEDGGASPLDGGSLRGIDGVPLEAVSWQGLAAVVGPLDPQRWDEAPDLPGQREERLRGDQKRYQEVNLSLLEHGGGRGVVPLRFGLVAPDRDGVREVLGRICLQLKTVLKRLRGSVELVVQASWDLPRVLKEIRDEGAILGAASGANAPLDPVEVGRALFEAAEARKKRFTDAVHAALLPLARQCAEGPRRDDSTILNVSFLVEKEKETLFDDAVNALANEFEGSLSFRYMGPLPAYSFAAIELTQGNFGLVDGARKALELPERATPEEIRASYRRLMLEWHPDRNPDRPEAAARCKELIEANEILTAYSESLPPGTPACSFARSDVEETFVLKERLQG